MLVLSAVDFTGSIFSCEFTGFFLITSSVFCEYPRLNFIVGPMELCKGVLLREKEILGTWQGSSLLVVILAVCRLLTFRFPPLAT